MTDYEKLIAKVEAFGIASFQHGAGKICCEYPAQLKKDIVELAGQLARGKSKP